MIEYDRFGSAKLAFSFIGTVLPKVLGRVGALNLTIAQVDGPSRRLLEGSFVPGSNPPLSSQNRGVPTPQSPMTVHRCNRQTHSVASLGARFAW